MTEVDPDAGRPESLDQETRELAEAGAAPQPTVALLGTGIMGLGMGGSILRAGLPLRAWNRTAEHAEPLAEQGAEVLATPQEAVSGADLVVTMLSDIDATAEVAERALPGTRDGAIWVQMGTVGVAGTQQLAALAVDHGVAFVDAPVSGTKRPAESGNLVVLAAGAEILRPTVAPLFDAVGSRTVWVDAVPGGGTRLKLVVNDWLCTLLGGLSEAIVLAESLDLDPQLFLDTIEGGPLGVAYAALKGGAIIDRSYPVAFPARHAAKDVGLVLEAAASAGVDLPVTRAVQGLFERVLDAGRGHEDMAVLAEGLRADAADG